MKNYIKVLINKKKEVEKIIYRNKRMIKSAKKSKKGRRIKKKKSGRVWLIKKRKYKKVNESI